MTHRSLSPLLAASLAACASEAPPSTPHHHGPGDHPHGADHPHGHGHHGGPLVHRFENAEQWAKEFDNPERDAWQKPADVVAALAITQGMTVADVGAGTGYFLPHLARAVGPKGKVIGVDIEPSMVDYMTKRAAREGLSNVEARLALTDDPKLAPASVDRVLIVDTWHHIASRPAYAQKLAAALTPGGMVFVVDFTLDSKRGPPPEHRIAPQKVIEELGQAGFKATVVDAKLPDQYIVAAKR